MAVVSVECMGYCPCWSVFINVGVYVCRTDESTQPQAEWCLPNRRLDIPDEFDILAAAKRLVEYTKQHPHLTLEFDPSARELFDSYGVMFNTRANQLRKGADADAAAEEGITCPWLSMSCAHIASSVSTSRVDTTQCPYSPPCLMTWDIRCVCPIMHR